MSSNFLEINNATFIAAKMLRILWFPGISTFFKSINLIKNKFILGDLEEIFLVFELLE